MQGKVEICGVNTSRLHVLSQVEMDALLRRAQAGDEDAREKLIEGNLRLVLSVIQRFDKRGENPDDLFQVGCIGLIKAISNFDPDKQVRFSTYGVPMIAGEVRRYLRDNSVIRVSRSIRDVAYRVLQCKEALITRLGREPTLEEISKELEIHLEDVSRALDAVCAPASLYDPVYSDGGDPLTVMDQVRDTKNTEDGWMEHITLQNAFRALNDREKQILSLRFYDGKTQMEVASALGISQAQVSRLEKGAIGAMRKSVSVSKNSHTPSFWCIGFSRGGWDYVNAIHPAAMQGSHLRQRRATAGVCDGCAGGDPQRERLRHRRPMPRAVSGRLRAAGRFYHSMELHQAHRPGHRAGGGEARRLPGAERKAGAAKIAQPRRNSFPRAGIFLRFLGNNACNYAFHPI